MSSLITNELPYRCHTIVESEEETTGLKKLNVRNIYTTNLSKEYLFELPLKVIFDIKLIPWQRHPQAISICCSSYSES